MAAKKDSLNLQLLLYREKYHLKKLHDYLIDQQLHDSGFVKLHHNSDQGILQKVNLYQKKVHHTCPLNILWSCFKCSMLTITGHSPGHMVKSRVEYFKHLSKSLIS